MGSNRERFERELIRGRHYDLFAVVVEASLADVSNGRYRSEMKAKSALQSIITFRCVTGSHSCGQATGRGGVCYPRPIIKYLREIGERFKQAVKAQEPREEGVGTKSRPAELGVARAGQLHGIDKGETSYC